MDPKALQKILSLEIKGLMELASEVDSQQFDVTIQADALSVDTLTVAHAGTPLADLFTAPADGVNKTLKVLTKSAPMQGTLQLNQEGYKKFISGVIDALQKDETFKDVMTPDIVELFKSASEQATGCMSGTINFNMETGLKLQVAQGIVDEKKYAELLPKIAVMMAADGPLSKFNRDLGLKTQSTFQTAVREHAGIKVNKIKTDVDTTNMPPDQAERLKKLIHDMETALANKMYLVASDPAEMDAMIDKALAGDAAKPDVSLEAITDLGNGKQLYFDYDFMGMIKTILATMPPNPGSVMFAQVKSSAPIVGAGSYDGGRLFMQTKVPLAGFIEMGQMAMRMQQGGGQPPAPRRRIPRTRSSKMQGLGVR